jgi:CBS-domain-containing membrane protein
LHNTYDVMEGVRRNFSKETTDTVIKEYDCKIEALQNKIEMLLAKIHILEINNR